jgi:hypothetical protein
MAPKIVKRLAMPPRIIPMIWGKLRDLELVDDVEEPADEDPLDDDAPVDPVIVLVGSAVLNP